MNNPEAVFGALSDPTRRQVFDRLVSAGPMTATSLASEFPITRQAVAKHLGVLEDVGLVERQVVGREARFHAVPGPLDEIRAWIDRVGSQWDQRLDRLRDRLGRGETF